MTSKYMMNIQETHDIKLPIFSVPCETFGTMRLDSRNCSHVTLTVNVNPQSPTFAFYWFLRVNGSATNVSKTMPVLRKTFVFNFCKISLFFVQDLVEPFGALRQNCYGLNFFKKRLENSYV